MITTVINYCTNDYRFLSFAIREAKKFSSHVIVVVADHFFDGKKEDRNLLNHTYKNHPDVRFVEYAFDRKAPYGLYPRKRDDDLKGVQYWHSTSRYIGYHYLPKDCEYVLFIDADEIAEGDRVKRWLDKRDYKHYDAIRFVSYFYFRSASQRAKKETRNALLVRKSAILPETLLDVHERRGTFMSIRGERLEDVRGDDGDPLFHHYSWVKTKSEAKRKVETWGHKNDRNWKDDIKREYSEIKSSEEIYNFVYEMVDPFCDPLAVSIPSSKMIGDFRNVKLVVPKSVFKRSVRDVLN